MGLTLLAGAAAFRDDSSGTPSDPQPPTASTRPELVLSAPQHLSEVWEDEVEVRGRVDATGSEPFRSVGLATTSVAVSRAAHRLATTHEDGSVRLRSLNGQELAVLRGHSGRAFRACFTADGRKLITTSLDGTARTWLVHDKDVLEHARRKTVRTFTEAELQEFGSLLAEESR